MLIEKNTFQNLHKMVKTYEKNPTGDASLFQVSKTRQIIDEM